MRSDRLRLEDILEAILASLPPEETNSAAS
jgi:hypothetical protein